MGGKNIQYLAFYLSDKLSLTLESIFYFNNL